MTRKIVKQFGEAFVISGPLFLPNCTKEEKVNCANCKIDFKMLTNNSEFRNGVSVPTHFFKVVIVPGKGQNDEILVSSFILPNRAIHPKTKLEEFYVPLEELEELAGLEFLPQLQGRQYQSLCKLNPKLCLLNEPTPRIESNKK